MQLSILSWSSTDLAETTDINNGTDFKAWYDANQVLVPERSGIYQARSNRNPKLAGVTTNDVDFTFKIQCKGTFHTQRETIKKYFSPESYAIGTLKFADTANTNKEWYIKGMPTRVNEETPGVMAVTLGLDEPYLRSVLDSTSSWAVTATGQTTDVTVTGNMNSHPVITITPTSGKTADFQYSRWVAIYNPSGEAFTNYPFDFGGFDTAALVSANKMQSAGQDLRLRIGGTEVPRWLGTTDGRGANTTDTAIWGTIDLAPVTDIYLKIAVDSTSTTFVIDRDLTDPAAFLRVKDAANKVIMFESEAIIYSSLIALTGNMVVTQRGAKGTSAASHAKGIVGHHIQFDSWVMYGSSDAESQSVNDEGKPMIELHSTNTSWIYTNYWTTTNAARPGSWLPSVTVAGTGRKSTYYTADHATNATPASEMGMSLIPYQMLNIWKTDQAEVVWRLTNSSGILSVQASGEKYRKTTGWAGTAGLQFYNTISRVWQTADNQASPTSDSSWTAFTIASTDTGALSPMPYSIQFILSGSISGSSANSNSIEFDGVTLALDSSGIPVKTIGAETSQYRIDATITNTTTGEAITLDWLMALNRVLTIDCDAKTVTYDDNTNAFGAITLSTVRDEWLDLRNGSNTLQYDETGAAGLTLSIEFENRNTL